MKPVIFLENINLNYPLTKINEKLFSKNSLSFHNIKNNKIVGIKNINLKISEGERVGIQGNNGAGKTTLLKVISKIYEPNSGVRNVNGNISVMLDTNCGMEKDATGYENIFLYLYARGVKKQKAIEISEFVIKFSELGNSLHFPIRTYSSGMITRLVSSILLAQKPEIFISDEFFLTGDNNYVKKMQAAIDGILSSTKVFILASHNHELLKKMCNRIITMEKGEIINDVKNQNF